MESIIASIVTGGLALIGVIYTNSTANKKIEMQLLTAQAVTNEKLEQLAGEVRKHNTFNDRILKLEMQVQTLEKAVEKLKGAAA